MDDEEVRRLVREAAEAARQAQEAAERAAAEPPTRWDALLAALTNLVTTLVDVFTHRLRDAADHARRAGEEAVARVLLTISRSLRHVGRAAGLIFLAALLSGVAVIVLAIGLTRLLDMVLGEPYGTLLVGVGALLLAIAFAQVARRRLRAVADEARLLAPTLRDR